eukprot:TRINITY_DN2299_c0_g2_i1.p1 TRINITY_DN2299_c0_g2~~TRINITY_DN2299_c0_g2_i1.p1  ORF type:complete len:314 (+),score=123.95 TRINITY_DN2299_c0_g2_i1:560-1501(+)
MKKLANGHLAPRDDKVNPLMRANSVAVMSSKESPSLKHQATVMKLNRQASVHPELKQAQMDEAMKRALINAFSTQTDDDDIGAYHYMPQRRKWMGQNKYNVDHIPHPETANTMLVRRIANGMQNRAVYNKSHKRSLHDIESGPNNTSRMTPIREEHRLSSSLSSQPSPQPRHQINALESDHEEIPMSDLQKRNAKLQALINGKASNGKQVRLVRKGAGVRTHTNRRSPLIRGNKTVEQELKKGEEEKETEDETLVKHASSIHEVNLDQFLGSTNDSDSDEMGNDDEMDPRVMFGGDDELEMDDDEEDDGKGLL